MRSSRRLLHFGTLSNDVQHRVLERFLVLAESVLFPGVVEHTLVKAVSLHAILEKSDARAIVGLLLKLELAAVLHELAELVRVTAAKFFKTGLNLLFLDVVVLLVFAATGKALPRQRAFDEVDQHVADRLEVIAPRLLDSLVGCDRCVPCCASQILTILVRNVLSRLIFVSLCEAEIDDVHVVTSRLRPANQKVIRFNIAVNDALLVNLFYAFDHLDADV